MLTKYNTEPNTETDALSCTETEQDDIEVQNPLVGAPWSVPMSLQLTQIWERVPFSAQPKKVFLIKGPKQH